MLENAIALHRAGRYGEAQRLYQDILRREPGNARAAHMLGQLALDAGAPQAATPVLERACQLDPANAAARNDLGRSLLTIGRAQEALAHFAQAVARDPKLASAHSNQGLALSALGRQEEALDCFSQALVLAPDNPQVHSNMGIALARQARNDEALARFDAAVAYAPRDPALHYNRADTLKNLRRDEEALAAYRQAAGLAPDFTEAWFNRGLLLARLGRFDEALGDIDRALTLAPQSAPMLVKRGMVLARLERAADALTAFDRAIALAPDFTDGTTAKLLFLAQQHGMEEAVQYGRQAARNPRLAADVEFNMALLLLQQGRWEEAWPLYAARKLCSRATETRGYPQPLWQGQPLQGKSLYIYAEQGMGDVIMFSRYLREAKAQGARVFFSPYETLARLMRCLDPDITILPWKQAPVAFDYHAPLLDLPGAFGTMVDNVPAPASYLHSEPALVEKWRQRIGAHGFRIGINWSGGIYITNASFGLERAFPLAMLEGLSRLPGVRLISLQKESAARELGALPTIMAVETLGEDFDTGPDAFVDTAAVMASLDLIISCDTSVAHLAGALGRPVWLALNAQPEWRWLLECEGSPWYPTMTLFRQRTPGDWQSVFAAMAQKLAKRPG